MFTIQCDITYVDGSEWHGSLAQWALAPPEAIDTIHVGGLVLSGDSVYYCQVQNIALPNSPEELAYILGSYAPYSSTKYSEFIFRKGSPLSRNCYFPPDLKHSEVKLGWWRVSDDG